MNWNKLSENMGQFKTFLRNSGSVGNSSGDMSSGAVDGSGGGAALSATSDNSNPPSPTKLGRRNKGGANAGDKNNSKEPCGMEKALAAATLRQNLEDIRLAQANGELKRFQLLQQLESFKVRCNAF